ncbi:glycosyltransferase family 32 protein [Rhodotorula toruloides]|uniref:Glycosyltransferase family 32 protein n=1 Tax=Rhodotorula toruloides TaxID=5286 RepID=A0A511K8C4_RHOTO|nr:glycosyltransferase family 32 protein [Rhodotorula toruloides]
MSVKRAITVLVILIALILAGTAIVLSTVVQYFGVDTRDVIQEHEMALVERLAGEAARTPGAETGKQHVVPAKDEATAQPAGVLVETDAGTDESVKDLLQRLEERGWLADNSTLARVAAAREGGRDDLPQPRIPKIIHATWKTDILPERWEKVRQGCIDLHPDYEFRLWSDAASRAFIAEHYPWFLSTFDGYTYPIQRADVIRYFVLHKFGGIYMDLDIGCRRNLDPLRYFRVILPQTIPVGVSNDLMFAEPAHPFMDLVIHNLITFDHTYGTNYPTVMFSTGPMFLSAVYGMWPKDTPDGVERQVRVLPRRWYGKNAPATEMEESYFDHYYGSSWHADDAGFITFLGKFGMALIYAGLAVVVLGVARLLWFRRSPFKATPRQIGPIALPYEALPFARPGTPGSRPGSPFSGGSRSDTPSNRFRRSEDGPSASTSGGDKPGGGGLFYMPVWLFPSSDRSLGSRTPDGAQSTSAWSQYFPNLSFVDDGSGSQHRYQPVPNFSRPPSPGAAGHDNDSILHAPGATHDGAFDGVHLHSFQPKSSTGYPSSSSAPVHHGSQYPAPNPQTPTSPNPPAYSALRSWGTSLFRGSSFLQQQQHGGSDAKPPILPISSADVRDDVPSPAEDRPSQAPRLSLPGSAARTPSPPEYATVVHGAVGRAPPSSHGTPDARIEVVDARGGPARTRSVGGRSSSATAEEANGDGSVERESAGVGGDDRSIEDQVDAELADEDAFGRRAPVGGEGDAQ